MLLVRQAHRFARDHGVRAHQTSEALSSKFPNLGFAWFKDPTRFFPKTWKTFSPLTRKELRFDIYPRHEGGRKTLGFIVGTNILVWMSWMGANISAIGGDPTALDWMERHFVATNIGMSKPENWHLFLTSSFSHQGFGHLLGNMTVLLLLGPRLHDFLGRTRFIILYLAGSAGGTLATQALHLDPTWEQHAVANSPRRYINILLGQDPGQALLLGASDAMSALFACFYFTFPRQPVPLMWAKMNITWTLLPQRLRDRVPQVGRVLQRTQFAAIWVLPAFFIVDFSTVWERLTGSAADSGLLPVSNTGHAAHIGGFLAGAAFYAAVAHPLKARYFTFTAEEQLRRLYVMALAVSFWYAVEKFHGKVLNEEDKNKKHVVLFNPTFNESNHVNSPHPDAEMLSKLWTRKSQLETLVQVALVCNVQESCQLDPFHGTAKRCDRHFGELRTYMKEHATSPRTAIFMLGPEVVDTVQVCRTWLRVHRQTDVHDGYRALAPTIHELHVHRPRRWFARFFSQNIHWNSLPEVGLSVKHTEDGLLLSDVRPESAACAAGCSHHVGRILTHVCHKPVTSEAEARAALRGSFDVHLWFEDRRTAQCESSTALEKQHTESLRQLAVKYGHH